MKMRSFLQNPLNVVEMFDIFVVGMFSHLNKSFNSIVFACVVAFGCDAFLMKGKEDLILDCAVHYSNEFSEDQMRESIGKNFVGLVAEAL